MGIFNRRKAEPEETRDLTWLPWSAGGPMPSQVTAEAAASLIPVFACTRIISTNIASLPIKAYRKDAKGQLVPNSFLPDLLFAPAARDNTFQWVQKCVVSLCLRGNAYGQVTSRDTYGMPKTVEWLHPDQVYVDESSTINPIYYWNGVKQTKDAIVHIPWIVEPGHVVGMSPIRYFANTIGVGLAAQAYGKQWFDNGGAPPSVMKNTVKTVSPDDAKEIRKRATAAIQTGQPLVIGNDWTFEAIKVTPEEAQFIQTMRMNASQIAAIYGVPPEMVSGDTGSSMTYSTVEQNSQNLANLTLRPWIANLETAFSNLLVNRDEIRFDTDAMYRMSPAERAAYYKTALDSGWLNRDEVRAKEHLPPLPNGEGQVYGTLKPINPDPVPAPGSQTPDTEQVQPPEGVTP